MKILKSLRLKLTTWGMETFKKTGVRQWFLAALVFVTLGGMLLANVVTERVDVSVGQVAKRDIEAPHRVINRYRTELLRTAEADRAVKAAVEEEENYVINQAIAVQAKERVATVFRVLIDAVGDGRTEGSGEGVAGGAPVAPVDVAQLQVETAEASSLDVPESVLAEGLKLSQQQLERVQVLATDFVSQVLRNERVSEENLQELRMELDERLLSSSREGQAAGRDLSQTEVALVAGVAATAIGPNLVLDLQRLNRAKDAALRNVKPTHVERGQSIVRKGDLVTEEHIQILQDLGMLKQRSNYTSALGVLLILALMMAMFGVYLYQHRSQLLVDEGHLALLGLVLIVVAGLTKVLSFFPSEGSGYLAPIALATMLIAILLDAHVAIMSAVFLSVIVGIVMGQEWKFAMVALISGLTGVLSVSRVGERSDLTRAGLVVGLVTFGAMVALGLFRAEMFMVKYSFLGVVNGLVSAVGAIGLFPYLESVFGITSSIRLLELSNPNQPLLRKLLMEAPGSYHHSMIVGNLSEAAAEAVGGDALLTRVGAQYHDIGKTKRPYFFIENQYGGENPHDKISPSLSTLIITSHPKDGVDLARQYKLPQCVVDFIRQHHGTSLVKYFYHKAQENAKDESCEEKDFRYPGPRPQSKETAIVLLADSVEAAVRTLNRPTPGRIEGLVRKIVKDHLADGQLDESNITLRDLDQISEAFVRVLTGIFHSRIDYPDTLLKEMEAKRA